MNSGLLVSFSGMGFKKLNCLKFILGILVKNCEYFLLEGSKKTCFSLVPAVFHPKLVVVGSKRECTECLCSSWVEFAL